MAELQFWMVYIKGKEMSIHSTLEAAMKEAERLAIKEGEPVFVLEAISCCRPILTWFSYGQEDKR